jgi:membrane protein implicated in regulation of membrane protease activity
MSMQQIRIQIAGPGQGPGPNGGPGILARILLGILAVLALVAAAFLGAIFFLAALGFFAVGMVVLAVRIWWARRQLEQAMKRGEGPSQGPQRQGARGRADVIEGEYLVVDEEELRRARDADREPGGDR